jgi:hypothetical protein
MIELKTLLSDLNDSVNIFSLSRNFQNVEGQRIFIDLQPSSTYTVNLSELTNIDLVIVRAIDSVTNEPANVIVRYKSTSFISFQSVQSSGIFINSFSESPLDLEIENVSSNIVKVTVIVNCSL